MALLWPSLNLALADQHEHEDEETFSFSEEELLEVRDEGVFDAEGNQVEVVIQEELEEAEDSQDAAPAPGDQWADYRRELVESWLGKQEFAQARLRGTQDNLEEERRKAEELEAQIAAIEEKLAPFEEKSNTLNQQIDLINEQMRVTQEKIDLVEFKIAETQVGMKDILLRLNEIEAEMNIQKEAVSDYIHLLYQEESQYFDLYDKQSSSTLKLLLDEPSVSENLLGVRYLEVMNGAGRELFYQLEKGRAELEEKKGQLKSQQGELDYLLQSLGREQQILKEAKETKRQLLEETHNEEEQYRLLLERNLKAQSQAALAARYLEENIELIERALNALDQGLDQVEEVQSAEQVEDISRTIDTLDAVSGGAASSSALSSQRFIWPLKQMKKITAGFHDPHYPAKYGQHQGIDLRAAHGTEVVAVANGYVLEIKKPETLAYSYIVLGHKDKIATIYGHMSQIDVQPGQVVSQGEVIGLSGATPGTKGAGGMTTGPHLHLEVLVEGKNVDPFPYLPWQTLPEEAIPDIYQKYLDQLKSAAPTSKEVSVGDE